AAPQPGPVGEGPLHPVGALEEVEEADHEGDADQRADHEHRDDADRVGVPVAERLHVRIPLVRRERTAAAPEVSWWKGWAVAARPTMGSPRGQPASLEAGGPRATQRIFWLRNSPRFPDRNTAAAASPNWERNWSTSGSFFWTVS